MSESILVGAGPGEGHELCGMLAGSDYRVVALDSLDELMRAVRDLRCRVVILDLDSLPVDNRFIRNLCGAGQDLWVIAVSGRTFHPELEESLRDRISVCLTKPVGEDELLYWLKSLCGGAPRSRGSPLQR